MTDTKPFKRSNFDEALYCYATGFYSGLSPKAPGTVGTAACAALLLLFNSVIDLQPIFIVLTIFVTALAIYAANYTMSRDLYPAKSDPQQIVIDEFAGLMVALIGLPINIWSISAAFIAFRVFDILKPPPVSHAELLPDGYGVVLDDVVAGLLANLSLRFLIFLGLISFQ